MVIVGAAAASVIALTLLTRPLVGALWGLVLVCAGAVHAYRWFEASASGVCGSRATARVSAIGTVAGSSSTAKKRRSKARARAAARIARRQLKPAVAGEQGAEGRGDEEVAEAHHGGAEGDELQPREAAAGETALRTALGLCRRSEATSQVSIAAIA